MRTQPPTRRSRTLPAALLGLSAVVLCGGATLAVTSIPDAPERVARRLSEARAQIWYALFPPGEAVFTPDPTLASIVQQTLTAVAPTPTSEATPTPAPSPWPSTTPTAGPTPTPIPSSVQLTGARHEYQKWNNCGPATLSMGLSFWGWDGDQRPIAEFTKPNPRDKNVMPYELAAFVEAQTDLRALVRVGGDLDLIKRLIAAGFPVIVEKGFEGYGFEGWMGHYALITGYDDARQQVTTQDSYISSNFPFPYDDLVSYWRNFNYTYLVIFPPDREAELLSLLGGQADEAVAFAAAAEKASEEIFRLSGRDQLFAWFNRGSSLVALDDYAGAALAFDEAFAIDTQMAVADPDNRPWRMLWYQTGPYWAYFYSGRYDKVIGLATQTLVASSEPVLEESYYWRGLAWDALGDRSRAIEDMRSAVEMHPGFDPALFYLQQWGVQL